MGKIANAVQTQQTAVQENRAGQSVNAMLNGLLDGNKMRGRFEELLGKRTAQFMSSLVTMINDNEMLQKAFMESPMSVIKSALQAASYDLPIDPALGFAYIVPFNNSVKIGDSWVKKMAATFVIGYKGLVQLCLRTGAYDCVPDAVDVREGELISYDRLSGKCEFRWIEDEDEREKAPVIGYAGYFRLLNGANKTIYMSRKEIEAHEKKNRKGKEMTKGWREDFDSMARKTVIRRLCSKYALMSIQYQESNKATLQAASALAESDYKDIPDAPTKEAGVIDGEFSPVVDERTGEVVEPQQLPDAIHEKIPESMDAQWAENGQGKLPWEV